MTRFKLNFNDLSEHFCVEFKDAVMVSDGGYERGYAEGYDVGNTDGYSKGHTEGVKQGYEEGVASVPDYLDQLMKDTLIDYKNETATVVKANLFNECKSLKSVEFPSVTTIGDTAFYSNIALEFADFPKATSIGTTAFIACKNLKTLILRNTESVCTLANINALNQTPIESGTGYVYVPKSLVEQYKVATNWTTYANQIRAIEDYPEIVGG